MADAEKQVQQSEAEAQEAAPKRKGRSLATMGIFGGVMIVEGLAIFMAMNLFGADPDPTIGVQADLQTTTAPFEESREMSLGQVRVQNTSGARPMLYSVGVTIVVRSEHEKEVDRFVKNRMNTVQDTLSRLVRSADEKHLNEPGLETIKRQIRYEMGLLIGKDSIIEQVLIQEFTPLPAGF